MTQHSITPFEFKCLTQLSSWAVCGFGREDKEGGGRGGESRKKEKEEEGGDGGAHGNIQPPAVLKINKFLSTEERRLIGLKVCDRVYVCTCAYVLFILPFD